MKTIIMAVVVMVGVMAVLVQINQPDVEYVREEATLEVVEPEVWMTDEDAIKAAKDVIRKKELEAELAILQSDLASTTSRIKDVEKELGTY
jgi:hypothetical protein